MRLFSGIQPTGRKHLGNYLGAIRQYVEGQDRGDPAIYCIVDLHATSVSYDPSALPRYVYDTAAMLMAAGLDPDRCVLFRQSDVREHTELCWLLCSATAYGDLTRMHQFKEKVERERELVRASLFLYPVLQAADVLAYRAHEVPVGDDQRQHVELMRDIAERFNAAYGDVLVAPEHRIPGLGARIMDLQDPTRKMSPTGSEERGLVFVDDDEHAIVKKVKAAVTDSGSDVRRAPEKPGISNLIDVLAAVRGTGFEEVERAFAGSRYGDFKGAVAEEIADFLRPARDRYSDLRPDEAALEQALARGADQARAMAAETLRDVRRAMGIGAPGLP
ncbi:tryptophan--tRNA ligase [soil metagenome]